MITELTIFFEHNTKKFDFFSLSDVELWFSRRKKGLGSHLNFGLRITEGGIKSI